MSYNKHYVNYLGREGKVENQPMLFKKEKGIIKSISYDQDEILQWIINLYCPNGFELDPTYSVGNFYKGIPQPKYKFDIAPQSSEVTEADCRDLPFRGNVIASIIFDPPFVGGSRKDGKPGIIKTRFGYYKNIQTELWGMYRDALVEFYRILKQDGVLVFKCQDTIESAKQYFSHVEIINTALSIGFYPKDLFVLLAKSRLISPLQRKQQHARKFHSYFLVFLKQKNPVKYFVEGNNVI